MRLYVQSPDMYFDGSFNLRREAAPHATSTTSAGLMPDVRVSISDEKPLHMRRRHSQGYGHYHGDVSISDEKPLHMRQCLPLRILAAWRCFNLRREAAPHATRL